MQFKEWQRGPKVKQEVFAGFTEQRKLQQKWNDVVYLNEFELTDFILTVKREQKH